MLRDKLRNKLQRRQEMRTDFSISSEHLYFPITTATKDIKTSTGRALFGAIPEEGKRREVPVIDVLEKISAETGKTQQGIQELKTQREYEHLDDIDDENLQPEEGDVDENIRFSKPEQDEEDQPQGAIGGRENILKQDTIAIIRGLDDKNLFDFTVRNFEKKKRNKYIISGRGDRINDIDDWSRMIFLANNDLDKLLRGDNDYRAFKSEERSRKDELKSIKKGKSATKKLLLQGVVA